MKRTSNKKSRKISTRLIRKGALIEETYTAFQYWNLSLSIKDNLKNIKETNPVGATNESWLHEITTTLSSRFTDDQEITPLVILAQRKFPIEKWSACLLWHIGNIDELYYRFATEWLYQEHRAGTYIMRTDDVIPFVKKMTDGRIASGKNLSEYGTQRAGRDLLRMAVAFGLLEGSSTKEFISYHLFEESFLYLLHAIADQETNTQKVVESPDWRMYLMDPIDVERELFHLHQYQMLEYDVAGSISQLKLPCDSLIEYVEEKII